MKFNDTSHRRLRPGLTRALITIMRNTRGPISVSECAVTREPGVTDPDQVWAVRMHTSSATYTVALGPADTTSADAAARIRSAVVALLAAHGKIPHEISIFPQPVTHLPQEIAS